MAKYLVREIAGWLLVLLGLAAFYQTFSFLVVHQNIVEAPVLAAIGIVLFRGGIHLLKVAVAAEICLRAQAELPAAKNTARRPVAPPTLVRSR